MLAGTTVYAATQLAILTVFGKLGNAALLGEYAVALAVAVPVVTLCMLNLRALQLTDVDDRARFADYLGVRLLGMAAALVVIVGIAIVSFELTTALSIMTLGAAKAVEAISDVIFGFLQRHERMRRVAISQMAKGVLSLGAITIALRFTGSIAWCGVALTIAWSATLLLIDIPALRHLPDPPRLAPNFSIRELRGLVWRALPLGVVVAMLPLIYSVPRVLLERNGGLEDVGVYAAMFTLTLPGTLVMGATGQAASPRLAKAFARNERTELRMLIQTLLVVALVLGAVGLLAVFVAGDPLLRAAFSPEIAQRALHLPLVMIAGGLWYLTSVFGYVSTAFRRARLLPVAAGLCWAVTAIAGLWLIPQYGLSGAVITAVISPAILLPTYIIMTIVTASR
jgi:O-antigen/teichoic acid export membrane protein